MKQHSYVVWAEFQMAPASILMVFDDQVAAHAWAAEKRAEYERVEGLNVYQRGTTGGDENEVDEWDVDVHVDEVERR